MLTSYLVRCPYSHCRWFGSLLPCRKAEPIGAKPVVVFQCPQCRGEWQARVVGDDVRQLPLERAKELASV